MCRCCTINGDDELSSCQEPEACLQLDFAGHVAHKEPIWLVGAHALSKRNQNLTATAGYLKLRMISSGHVHIQSLLDFRAQMQNVHVLHDLNAA